MVSVPTAVFPVWISRLSKAFRLAVGIGFLASIGACKGESTGVIPPVVDNSIEAQIRLLFPAGATQSAAISQITSVRQSLSQSNTVQARSQALTLVDLTLTSLRDGLLTGGKTQSTRTSASSLVDGIYQLVSLDPPKLPEGSLTDDGAARIVGSEGATVVTPSGVAGVQIPMGALPAQVLVTVIRIPAPPTPGTGPLPTNLKQYPPFYEFSTSPAVAQFGDSVRVGVCQVTDPASPLYPPEATHDRLRLAHAVGSTIQILERVAVNDFLRCTGVTPNIQLDGWKGLLSSFLDKGIDLVRPTELYAAHGGLGGKTKSFSPFGAVDPASAPVATVVVAPDSLRLLVGASGQLTATLKDASGNVLTGRTVVWSLASTGVGVVSSTGLVTGIAAGTVTVIATSEGKGGFARVTVSAVSQGTTPDAPCGSGLKSTASDTPTTIIFNNQSNEVISWYWLDFTGTEVFYASEAPGLSTPQPTYVTHPWIVKGASGRCFGIYLPTASSRTIILR